MKLATILTEVAINEIGVEEIDGTNCGPRVNQYKAATNLPPKQSWPWCAAFICWCVQQAMSRSGRLYTFKRPTTAGAWDLENWSLRQDESTWLKKPHRGDIESGDILIYKFSHCGIAVQDAQDNDTVLAVEGNTDGQGSREGGAVLRKRRRLDQIRSRIRFRV